MSAFYPRLNCRASLLHGTSSWLVGRTLTCINPRFGHSGAPPERKLRKLRPVRLQRNRMEQRNSTRPQANPS